MMTAYAAYDKGFLPVHGGTDDQPALFIPIVLTISSAINDEQSLEDDKRKKHVSATRPQDKGAPPGYAKIPVPGKR